MSLLPFLIIPLLAYTLLASLGLLVVLGLSRKTLEAGLLAAYLLPICAWLVLVLINGKGKTLANAVFEPVILAVLVCILAVVHCLVDRQGLLSSRALDIVTVALSVLVALSVFFLMPALPE